VVSNTWNRRGHNLKLTNIYRHLMTGTGAYMSLVWGIWLRHCLNERQDEYELSWPRTFTSLPEIVRANPEKWKGAAESKKEL
jgi:dihydroceramidase